MSLMALKLFPILIPFPVSAPNPNPDPNPNPNPFEVRFARWNNANGEKFNERRRSQQEIEDDLRRLRRFNSITKITHNYNPATPTKISVTHPFKSVGTPSSPSRSSIPGRKSKYSKPESHPAFRPRSRITKLPPPPSSQEPPVDRNATINLSDDGLSYIVDGAPFEFKYSYTETPKVKPLKLREAPFSPFGPTTMPRPWTGRAPSQPTKKKLKEFDSFQLPPPHKKGVKPVQSPGPFRPGSGPRYVYSREEILGEPLTEEEIQEMVNSSLRSDRQLNMGRDGLTHNMLDNIHAHWKRRRVCKIKCKGVCTVDMDNVYQQLEEKTGGKIIYKKGGVLYLFRGRNYNYRTRPRFPLMLWKPMTPLYPRLVERVPKGLTLEEASEMRTKGRMLIPICKLAIAGKNGVYSDLPRQVREAFEECELVRINCQGVKGSDYRKIGAKLRDVVPCVLISFEREHILMWRGRDWKSMFTKPNDCAEAKGSSVDIAASTVPQVANQEIVTPPVEAVKHNLVSTCSTPPVAYQDIEIPSVEDASHSTVSTSIAPSIIAHQDDDMPSVEDVNTPDVDTSIPRFEGKGEDLSTVERAETCESMDANSITANIYQSRSELDNTDCSSGTASKVMNNTMNGSEAIWNDTGYSNEMLTATLVGSDPVLGSAVSKEMLEDVSEMSCDFNEPAKLSVACTEGVLLLLKQAVENGSAIVLDDAALDSDILYQRAVSFAKSAPPDPVYKRRHKPEVVQEYEKKQESEDLAVVEDVAQVNKVATVSKNSRSNLKTYKVHGAKELNELYVDPPPKGTLGIDELAKLLA